MYTSDQVANLVNDRENTFMTFTTIYLLLFICPVN